MRNATLSVHFNVTHFVMTNANRLIWIIYADIKATLRSLDLSSRRSSRTQSVTVFVIVSGDLLLSRTCGRATLVVFARISIKIHCFPKKTAKKKMESNCCFAQCLLVDVFIRCAIREWKRRQQSMLCDDLKCISLAFNHHKFEDFFCSSQETINLLRWTPFHMDEVCEIAEIIRNPSSRLE